jgi:hypothetical protein
MYMAGFHPATGRPVKPYTKTIGGLIMKTVVVSSELTTEKALKALLEGRTESVQLVVPATDGKKEYSRTFEVDDKVSYNNLSYNLRTRLGVVNHHDKADNGEPKKSSKKQKVAEKQYNVMVCLNVKKATALFFMGEKIMGEWNAKTDNWTIPNIGLSVFSSALSTIATDVWNSINVTPECTNIGTPLTPGWNLSGYESSNPDAILAGLEIIGKAQGANDRAFLVKNAQKLVLDPATALIPNAKSVKAEFITNHRK